MSSAAEITSGLGLGQRKFVLITQLRFKTFDDFGFRLDLRLENYKGYGSAWEGLTRVFGLRSSRFDAPLLVQLWHHAPELVAEVFSRSSPVTRPLNYRWATLLLHMFTK